MNKPTTQHYAIRVLEPDGTGKLVEKIYRQEIPPTWADIRKYRDYLLRETDWTQIGDSPLDAVKMQAWKNYRTTLRNIPQTYANPTDVVWPEIPVSE